MGEAWAVVWGEAGAACAGAIRGLEPGSEGMTPWLRRLLMAGFATKIAPAYCKVHLLYVLLKWHTTRAGR